jgi:hypothetical protein
MAVWHVCGTVKIDLRRGAPRCELPAGWSGTVVRTSASYKRVYLGPLHGGAVAALRCCTPVPCHLSVNRPSTVGTSPTAVYDLRMTNFTFIAAWQAWWSGQSLIGNELYGVPVIFIARAGMGSSFSRRDDHIARHHWPRKPYQLRQSYP